MSHDSYEAFSMADKCGIILNQELGEPFRRDAMKKPVEVAGIEKGDMKPQKSLVG